MCFHAHEQINSDHGARQPLFLFLVSQFCMLNYYTVIEWSSHGSQTVHKNIQSNDSAISEYSAKKLFTSNLPLKWHPWLIYTQSFMPRWDLGHWLGHDSSTSSNTWDSGHYWSKLIFFTLKSLCVLYLLEDSTHAASPRDCFPRWFFYWRHGRLCWVLRAVFVIHSKMNWDFNPDWDWE